MYYIYTDGSTKKNGNESNIGGYAFIVVNSWDGKVIDAYAENNIKDTTNNRMELTAILAALFMYQRRMRQRKDINEYIQLYSDSNYALKSLFEWSDQWNRNGWKTSTGTDVKNLDLIKPFYDRYWGPYLKNSRENKKDSWRKFSYAYVQAHNGNLYNELADKMATGEMTPKEVIEKYGYIK